MIKLYGMFPSRATRCVWALEEAGVVDYTIERLDFAAGEQLSPDYLALNPLGKVPTLVVGGTVIYETIAILEYIGRTYPAAQLVPANGRDYVKYMQWVSYLLTEVEGPFWTMLKHSFVLPEERRVPAVIPTCLWEVQRALVPVENHLSAGLHFLMQERLTNVDILLGTMLMFLKDKLSLDDFSSCGRYLEELSKREAFQRTIAKTA